MKMEHYPELGYRRNKRRMKLQLYNLFLEKREVNKVMSEISTQKYKGLIASALKKVMVNLVNGDSWQSITFTINQSSK